MSAGGVPRRSTSVRALAARFLAERAAAGWRPCTQHVYRWSLERLARVLDRLRVADVRAVTSEHVAAFAAHVRSASYAPQSILALLVHTRMFFRWLVRSGVLLIDPACDVSLRGLSREPAFERTIPDEATTRRLLERLPRQSPLQIRNWALLELAYSSGLRVGELRGLDLYDVDLLEGLVHLRNTKGGRFRTVPVGRPACLAIAVWLEKGRPQMARAGEVALFVKRDGRRMSRWTVDQWLSSIRDGYGLGGLRVHDLRHASAVHMLRQGANVRDIQAFLGHSCLMTTQIYTHLVPADLKRAHRLSHPRERHKR